MRLPNIKNNLLFRWALVAGILCGFCGVLVDIDHALSYWLGWANERFLHPWLFLGSGIVLCCLIACIGGFYRSLVLKGRFKK